MTYVSAFMSASGIVMCADTQESYGEFKNYVEKLRIVEDHSYPLAIGGAGIDDLIEPVTQEIIDRAKEQKPSTRLQLRELIKAAITEVYDKELPFLVLKKQHRTPELIIAAKPPEDDFCIYRVKGKRLYSSALARAIIGYATTYNFALLKRLHTKTMSIQQAVLLAAYLVSQSIVFDEGVGGDPRIVVVTDKGAWSEDSDYVKSTEKRFLEFHNAVNGLILACPDMSITEAQFDDVLISFKDEVRKLRDGYKREIFSRFSRNPRGQRADEPYLRIPLGIGASYPTKEDMESANPATMRLTEADQMEGKKKLYGPVLWLKIQEEVIKLAAASGSASDPITPWVDSDWSMLVSRFKDPGVQTAVRCHQDKFTIECRGTNLKVDYRLVVKWQAGQGYARVFYEEDGSEKTPEAIAQRIVESVLC